MLWHLILCFGDDARHLQHLQDALAIFIGFASDDEHLAAELGERVGNRKAGHPEAKHRNAQATPFCMPAGKRIEFFGHSVSPAAIAHSA